MLEMENIAMPEASGANAWHAPVLECLGDFADETQVGDGVFDPDRAS